MATKADKGLDTYMDEAVSVITNDGRNIVVCDLKTCCPTLPNLFAGNTERLRPNYQPCAGRQLRASIFYVRCGFNSVTSLTKTTETVLVPVSRDVPVEMEHLGLYVIRGDNMCVFSV